MPQTSLKIVWFWIIHKRNVRFYTRIIHAAVTSSFFFVHSPAWPLWIFCFSGALDMMKSNIWNVSDNVFQSGVLPSDERSGVLPSDGRSGAGDWINLGVVLQATCHKSSIDDGESFSGTPLDLSPVPVSKYLSGTPFSFKLFSSNFKILSSKDFLSSSKLTTFSRNKSFSFRKSWKKLFAERGHLITFPF